MDGISQRGVGHMPVVTSEVPFHRQRTRWLPRGEASTGGHGRQRQRPGDFTGFIDTYPPLWLRRGASRPPATGRRKFARVQADSA